MFSVCLMSLARIWDSRQISIFILSAAVAAALGEASARGAASDTLRITYADGTPVVVNSAISVDYKIGSAATVVIANGTALGKLELPEPALETTDEGRLVVNIRGYVTINPAMMVGLGSRSAYLREPDEPGKYSDIMQCVTRENQQNSLHRDFEFTLISTPDPALASANPLIGYDLVTTETGSEQDLSTGLFIPTPLSNQDTAPFHVYVISDVDVPEPGGISLLAVAGLAVLGPFGRGGRRRQVMA